MPAAKTEKESKAKHAGKAPKGKAAKKEPEKTEKPLSQEKEQKGVQDPFDVLRFVLMTEKAIQLIEAQNKLVFIVDRRKGKKEIKEAAEAAFQSKVRHVNTMIDQLGRKKAFIKFREPGQAGEIAIRLGII